MTAIRIVVPDTGPLITLAKLQALDTLLVFKPSVRIVITDYVAFEATRRRNELPDAKAIHAFLRDNAGRIEIEKTTGGSNYMQLVKLQEQLATNPALATQLGISLTPPSDPGEMTIIEYVRSLVDKPPGTPALIIAEDDYLLRDVVPLPGNAHVISTRAFLDALPLIAELSAKPKLWGSVKRFREDHNAAATVDRAAAKIPTTWTEAVDPPLAAAVVRAARRRRP